jgi:hypothetical protein
MIRSPRGKDTIRRFFGNTKKRNLVFLLLLAGAVGCQAVSSPIVWRKLGKDLTLPATHHTPTMFKQQRDTERLNELLQLALSLLGLADKSQ